MLEFTSFVHRLVHSWFLSDICTNVLTLVLYACAYVWVHKFANNILKGLTLTLSPSDFPTDIHHSATNACIKQTICYTPIKLYIKLFCYMQWNTIIQLNLGYLTPQDRYVQLHLKSKKRFKQL